MTDQIQYPEADKIAALEGRSYYAAAVVCKRGHVETKWVRPGDRKEIAARCPTCGADLLRGCPSCGIRIRGEREVPGVIGSSRYSKPSFCDGCGAAMPWATRQERIFELENLLDQETIDEADRVVVSDNLARMRSANLNDKQESQLWIEIAKRSGDALKSPRVMNVVEGLASAALRAQLGL